MPNLCVFKIDVLDVQKAFLLCETLKTVFSQFILAIDDMGIQGVTRGDKR